MTTQEMSEELGRQLTEAKARLLLKIAEAFVSAAGASQAGLSPMKALSAAITILLNEELAPEELAQLKSQAAHKIGRGGVGTVMRVLYKGRACVLKRSAIPLSAVQGCIDWAQSSSGEILSKLLKDILETGSQAAPIAFALELSANINGAAEWQGQGAGLVLYTVAPLYDQDLDKYAEELHQAAARAAGPAGARKVPLIEILNLCLDVATALADYHHRNTVHGDLKPANMLLEQAEGRLKAAVADLGTLTVVPKGETMVTSNLKTFSPTGFCACKTSDIFAVSVSLLHLVFGTGSAVIGMENRAEAFAGPWTVASVMEEAELEMGEEGDPGHLSACALLGSTMTNGKHEHGCNLGASRAAYLYDDGNQQNGVYTVMQLLLDLLLKGIQAPGCDPSEALTAAQMVKELTITLNYAKQAETKFGQQLYLQLDNTLFAAPPERATPSTNTSDASSDVTSSCDSDASTTSATSTSSLTSATESDASTAAGTASDASLPSAAVTDASTAAAATADTSVPPATDAPAINAPALVEAGQAGSVALEAPLMATSSTRPCSAPAPAAAAAAGGLKAGAPAPPPPVGQGGSLDAQAGASAMAHTLQGLEPNAPQLGSGPVYGYCLALSDDGHLHGTSSQSSSQADAKAEQPSVSAPGAAGSWQGNDGLIVELLVTSSAETGSPTSSSSTGSCLQGDSSEQAMLTSQPLPYAQQAAVAPGVACIAPHALSCFTLKQGLHGVLRFMGQALAAYLCHPTS